MGRDQLIAELLRCDREVSERRAGVLVVRLALGRGSEEIEEVVGVASSFVSARHLVLEFSRKHDLRPIVYASSPESPPDYDAGAFVIHPFEWDVVRSRT
jgi:hypothetical protein